jgi:hypothetical protein
MVVLGCAGVINWVSQFPEGPLRDKAVEPVVFWGQGQDPAAIAAMLDSFGSADLMQKYGEIVASIWLNRDNAAASAWIQNSTLADDAKQRLLSRNNQSQ